MIRLPRYDANMVKMGRSTASSLRIEGCGICSDIKSIFNVPIQEDRCVNLGQPNETLESDCHYHQPLFNVVMALADATPADMDCFLMFKSSSAYHPSICSVLSGGSDPPEASFDGILTVQPWRHETVPIAVPSGLPIFREWVNPGLLAEWMETCSELHGDTCMQPLLSKPLSDTRPAFVVDTVRQCLVKPRFEDSYVALSYVWGESRCLVTVGQNLDSLQVPGSLSLDNSPTMSRTVRDSMAFVKVLGQRYLWVDALCITQDDEAQKHADIMNMAAIYANATITVVAAQGKNADAGLHGLEGISAPRDFTQRMCTLADNFMMSVRFDYKYGPWHSRGWTYQEEVFSRRRIVFEGDRVRWECRVSIWHEDTEHGWPEKDTWDVFNAVTSIQSEFSRLLPLSGKLVYAIRCFGARHFSYPEDASDAFAGVANAFSHSFAGGFISGLPAAYFHVALLWRHDEYCQRREPRKALTQVCLPSWSWLGWQCNLRSSMWLEAAVVRSKHDRNSVHSRFEPLVRWHFHLNSDDEGTPIHCAWDESRQQYYSNTNTQTPLPAGWSRHRVSEDLEQEENKPLDIPRPVSSNTVYRHESDPSIEFHYPIPLPDASTTTRHMTAAPFISCRTKRSWLIGGPHVGGEPGGLMISLHASDTSEVGTLDINAMFHSAFPFFKPDKTPEPRVVFELIEISKDCRVNVPQNPNWEGWSKWECSKIKELGSFEFYNVIGIFWKSGIAYRIGVGRVDATAWEATARELIDVKLG